MLLMVREESDPFSKIVGYNSIVLFLILLTETPFKLCCLLILYFLQKSLDMSLTNSSYL